MDDQRRPGSPHNHSPHHGNHTAVDGHKGAELSYKRARVNAIGGRQCNDLPSLLQVSPPPPLPSPSYHRSTTRPRGPLMRNLYFYVSCFFVFSVAKEAHSSPPQSSTLFAIMEDLGYHPLLAETWKGNYPCDKKWFGIHCGFEGEIKYIFLMSMNLTGTISPRFADLASLHALDLSHNCLTGTIPHELTKMMRLRLLDVSYNQLHGKIISRPETMVLSTNGNPGIIVMADIVRVPLQGGDKETASVVGFFFGIVVLGFLLIGGASVLFYFAKKVNHHV